MAKATGVKKGSKLNFYKFVETEEPKGKGSNPFGATTHFNNNTTAINQIGESVNGLISMVAELKELELARLDQINKNKPKPEPEPKDDKKKKAGNPLVNFAKNASKKSGDFLSGILGMLGNMLKMFIAIPALMWLADPANKEKLITVIKVLSKVGKFIFDFMKFGVITLMDGLYNMFKSDANIFERILGFGKALVGFATVFLGIRWLKNPLKLIKDIRMVVPKLIKFVTTLIAGKKKGQAGGLVKLGMNVLGVKTKGRATGGYVPLKKAASGGWISGPQTGYPVSLDGGMTTSFIGHGTEYVSQKADGGAFVVPFDTPATRRTPSLTNTRMKEAKRLGFADGGLLNITPPTFFTNNNNNTTFNNNNNTSNTTTNNISEYSKGGDISQKFLNNSQTSIDNTTNEYTKSGEITDKFLDNSKTFINEYSKGGRTLINNTTLKNNRTSTNNTTTNQYSKGGEVNNEFLYLPQTNMGNPLDTFQDQSYKPPIGNTVNYNSSPINNFSKGGDFKPLLNFAVGGKVNNISNFSTGGSVSNISTQPISISTTVSPMVQRTKIGMGFSEGGETPKIMSASTKPSVTKQTETRNESVNEVKTASLATLEATAATVMEVNTKNAQAIEQAKSATAGGGGEPETIVQGLPGSGTVNINGVLKTTATVLNSNNNYMKGLIK
tara:strand:+ start:3041 stop:5044 length:2004 start_codon:yes stop_codon:yes gene_type:complete